MSPIDDDTLLKALGMVSDAVPLMPSDEYPDEETFLRHRAASTLVRLARFVLWGVPYQHAANDFHLAGRRIEQIYGGPMPESSFGREPEPEEVKCLNCRAPATEERDGGLPVCADCGASWDRLEWGEELR